MNMYKTILILFLFFSLFYATSCGLNDSLAPDAAFIELKDPVVKQPSGVGFDTHKITDIWVFVDGQIIGIFPLPAKVPIEVTGVDVEVTFLAGIRNNGFNNTPVFYPFYKSILKTFRPIPGQLVSIPLEFSYVSSAKIPINESFEIGNSFDLDIDNNINTNLVINSETSILGQKCGHAILTNSLNYIEVASAGAIRNGENNRGASYIEFDYKGDGEIAVGILKKRGNIFQVEFVLFVPGKTDWNKIYIDVTNNLSTKDYEEYRLVFGFRRTGTAVVSNLFIDNIKHIHY